MVRVSNVPEGIDAQDLERAFGQTGRINDCVGVRGRKGEFLVTYSNTRDAEAAIGKYDGGTLNQSKIKVALCEGNVGGGPDHGGDRSGRRADRGRGEYRERR